MNSQPSVLFNPSNLAHSYCPVCQSEDLIPLLTIHEVPIYCNVQWSTREAALAASTGEIQLVFCEQCAHMFNASFDPALMEYAPGYENSLHFSPRFQSYAENLVKRLVDEYQLHDKTLLEVGCGQGEFLRMMCEQGDNQGIGFDPSYTETPPHGPRFRIIPDYYSEKYANYQADFIIARHVLEHISSPRDFLSNIHHSIGVRSTGIYFEVPNAAYILRELGIWDLIYEHHSYFTLYSLKRLFMEMGFDVQRIEETYNGQYLGIEALSRHIPSDSPSTHQEDMTSYAMAFAHHYHHKLGVGQQALTRIADRKQRAVIWGGGSKGVTFLNLLRDFDVIDYVVDINPHKQGKFAAGTGQQFILPPALCDYQPEVILIMNPLYQAEIQQTTAALGLSPTFMVV